MIYKDLNNLQNLKMKTRVYKNYLVKKAFQLQMTIQLNKEEIMDRKNSKHQKNIFKNYQKLVFIIILYKIKKQ